MRAMLECKAMRNRGHQVQSWERREPCLEVKVRRRSEEVDVDGLLELAVVTPDIIRLRLTESAFLERESESLVAPSFSSDWSLEETPERLILRTERLRVELDMASGALEWRDAAGRLLVREPADGGKFLQRTEVRRVAWDADAEWVEEVTVDGLKQRRRGTERTVVDRLAYSTTLALELPEEEVIYGLGQHEEGILDYRHRQQFLYQSNMKVAIPTFVSSRGYAFHFDQHCLGHFEGTAEGCRFWSETVSQMEFFFVHGPELDQIVSGLRTLTGRPPMLPRWAYGFIQSKERYETQAELIEVVRRYREAGVPLDCVVLDWSSWQEGWWGQKSLDPGRFPDPAGLMRELHALNARLMVSIWPNMRGGCPDEGEMKARGFLMGNGMTYDSSLPEARQLYWEQAREGLFAHGIDAWWCDCTEPFESDWAGSARLPLWARAQACLTEFKRYMDPEWINAYSLRHSRGLYEGQRATTEARRVVNLTRSAGPSQQRYGTITWSGDIEARWSRLRKQLADGLNFVVTGNPRWTFDIGAFFVKPGVQWFWDGCYPAGNADLGYRELYTRWYQTGAFLPMFRSHGTDTAREIWQFGEPGTPFYDTLKAFTELRYRLLPTLYSLAAREVFEDYTFFRSLAFDFRHDPACLRIADQFMLGPSLMVCPVLEPMYYDAHSRPLSGVERTRRVYLPTGTDWYDYWTGHRYAGGQWVVLDAPLERLPLLLRAGSLLVMGPPVPHSGAGLADPWEVHVYAGADARFDVYEDAGDGYAYEAGECCWTPLIWEEASRRFRVGTPRGPYPGLTATRSLTVTVHAGG